MQNQLIQKNFKFQPFFISNTLYQEYKNMCLHVYVCLKWNNRFILIVNVATNPEHVVCQTNFKGHATFHPLSLSNGKT